jgi:phosphatidylglycerol:prolipoprotein diacylglycerol transferase
MNYRPEYAIIQSRADIRNYDWGNVDSGIAFKLGPIVIHWYGLLIVLGILAGGIVASVEARRRGEQVEHVWSGLLWGLILGFLGARLYHILSSPADGTGGFRAYVEDPIGIFQVWDGGLAIIGAIAGGVLGLWLYARRHHLSAWRWLDIAAPGFVLAQALVRPVNFINQELYGPPTSLPWGVLVSEEHRLPIYSDLTRFPEESTLFHPTFFYESLWSLGIFVFLMWAGRRWGHRLRDGDIFLAYLVLFGLGRLCIEQFLRPDAWKLDNGLAVGALIALGTAVIAALLLLLRHRRRGRTIS